MLFKYMVIGLWWWLICIVNSSQTCIFTVYVIIIYQIINIHMYNIYMYNIYICQTTSDHYMIDNNLISYYIVSITLLLAYILYTSR